MNQKGFSPLAILILVVLGVFIIWELNLTLERKFSIGESLNSPSPSTSGTNCDFPDPNDPCDLDSGAGFHL